MTMPPAKLRGPTVGFAAICLGYFAIILDGSVLNVAIPAVRADLHASLAGAQWVLNAYTLTLAGLLLTAGALGDRIGLRRMFLFGTSRVHGGIGGLRRGAVDRVLIAARVVQGVGAAALLPRRSRSSRTCSGTVRVERVPGSCGSVSAPARWLSGRWSAGS